MTIRGKGSRCVARLEGTAGCKSVLLLDLPFRGELNGKPRVRVMSDVPQTADEPLVAHHGSDGPPRTALCMAKSRSENFSFRWAYAVVLRV